MKINLQHSINRTRHWVALLVLAVVSTVMLSCGGKVEPGGSSDTTKLPPTTKLPNTRRLNPCDSARRAANIASLSESSFIETFPAKEAAQLMSAFMAKTQLLDLATKCSFGGEFPVSTFKLAAGDGVLMWFCYDKATSQFFLATEPYTKNEYLDHAPVDLPNTLPTQARSSRLTKPTHVFKYNRTLGTDPYTLESYLKTHKETISAGSTTIDNTTANTLIKNFKEISDNYVAFGFSYITENEKGDLARFVASTAANGYVRYYFGYEEVDRDRQMILPNKIRVIFVTADASGVSRAATSPSTIIQSSWPPPPW